MLNGDRELEGVAPKVGVVAKIFARASRTTA